LAYGHKIIEAHSTPLLKVHTPKVDHDARYLLCPQWRRVLTDRFCHLRLGAS
jgi:hypothetical protein